MEREELKNALIALRSALDNVIRAMEGKGAETPSEGKRDTTVSDFWAALKNKDFVKAKELYQRFSAMDLSEKQQRLKVMMKNAIIEKYNQFKNEDDELPY